MAILISGTTNDITINGVSVATDAEVTSAVAPLATTEYVDGKMVLSTAVTASGTAIDFTSIPSWVKRITVMFNGVSTNGSSVILVQLGDSGGVENTDYISSSGYSGTTSQGLLHTTGFGVSAGAAASNIINGSLIVNLILGNTYIASNYGGYANYANFFVGGGSKTLSSTLDRIRITTVNGTDAFDAGQINIMYEG